MTTKNCLFLLLALVCLPVVSVSPAHAQSDPLVEIVPRPFSEGRSAIHVDGRFVILDVQGTIVAELDERVVDIGPFFEGKARCRVGGRYGFIGAEGTMAIQPQYAFAGSFSEGVAPVGVKVEEGDDRDAPQVMYGYIDHDGEMVIKPLFERAHMFSEGLAAVKRNGRWGYIDHRGGTRIAFQFDEVRPFSGGEAFARSGRWGIIDRTGVFVRKPEFIDIDDFSDGAAMVVAPHSEEVGGPSYGLIGRAGRWLVEPQYERAMVFSEGYAWVGTLALDDYWIDARGRRYDFGVHGTSWYEDGLLKVWDRERGYGYIDYWGDVRIPPQYEEAGSFSEGVAFVKDDGRWMLIDRHGGAIWHEDE